MNLANKKDIQSQKDKRKVTINKVGVKNVRYPITVDDKENKIQHTIADLDIYVELPHHHRGTHMSRFLEVLNEYHEDNLITNLEDFMAEVKEKLNADFAYSMIKFPYFVEKTAPVSKIKSKLNYDCFFEASYSDHYEITIGVKVPVTSLCPCSKEISAYGAHNQRSVITIKATYKDFIWLEDLIKYAEEAASCEVYSLLKRVDEKYVTEAAFDNPKFVEDIVRDLTVRLREDERITNFQVESENFESIHNHSAYACVKEEK